MAIEPRQLKILQALVGSEDQLRDKGRAAEWILMQLPRGRTGLKPGIPNGGSLDVTHADLLDLTGEGYVHELPYSGSTVLMKFALTGAGRAAGRPPAVVQQVGPTAPPPGPPPGLDEVLAWIVALESSPAAGALADGGRLGNKVIADFGTEHREIVAWRILDLRDEGLVRFEDFAAKLDQLSDADRLSMASGFRVTTAGRDRVRKQKRPDGNTHITQIINAVNAQVAAGDIQNYVTFQAFLDRAEEAIEALDDIDEQTREEAKGLLDKLRGATGTVATSAAGGAAGTVVGAVFTRLS